MGRGVVKDRNNYWSGTQTFERILVEEAIFLTGATFDLSGGNVILPSTLDSGAVQAKDNTGLKLQNDGGTEIFRVDDSGHIGLFGTANSSWGTDYRAVEGPNTTWLMSALPTGNEAHFVSHAYIDNAGWKYKTASEIPIKSTYGAGVFHISTANSGLVGDPLTWVDRLTVTTGGVGINNSNPSGSLDARSLQTDLGTTVTAANSDASKALFLYSGHDNQAPTLFWRGGLGMAFGTGYDYTSGSSQSSPTNYLLNQTFHLQGSDSGGLSNSSLTVICDGNAGTYYSINTNSTTSARGYAFIPNTGVGIHGRVIRAISFVSMAGYPVGDFKLYGRTSDTSFTTNLNAPHWTLLVSGNSTSVDVNSPDVFGFTNSTVFKTYMVHFTTSGEHRIAEMGMYEEVGFTFTKRMEILSSGNVEVANTLNATTLQEGSVDLSTKYILANQKGATNGICELSNGVVPNNRIPPLAISETSVVANLAAKYALTTQRGDIAIVTGINKTFIKLNDDAATTNAADWTELIPNAVVSVNGDTGPVVSIDTSVIAENTNLYYTDGRADARIANASINTLSDVGLALSAGNASKPLKINAAGNGVDQATFSLPSNSGSNGEVLTSNGSGATAWADPSVTFLDVTDTPSLYAGDSTTDLSAPTMTVTGSRAGASAVIDNNPSTSWQGNDPNNEYITVDFASAVLIGGISIDAYYQGGNLYAYDFKIEGSTNNSSWTDVFPSDGSYKRLVNQSGAQVFRFANNASYRYIKVTFNQTYKHNAAPGSGVGDVTINELEFYETAADYEVKVNSTASGLVFEKSGVSNTTFAALTDTPANFTSSGDKVVTVKTDTSGLEFTSAQDLIRDTQTPDTTSYNSTATISSHDHNVIFSNPSQDIALTLPISTSDYSLNQESRFYIKNVSGTHRVIVRGLSQSDHPQSEKLSASDSTASAGSFVLHPRESAVFQGFNGSGNYRVVANYRDDITQIVTSNTTQTKSAKNFVVTGTTALTIDLLDYPFWPLNVPILFKNSSTKELTLDPHLNTSIEGSPNNIKVPAGRSVTIQRTAASILSIVDSSRAFDLDSSGNAIFDSGKVGIGTGTNPPSARLHIVESTNSTSAEILLSSADTSVTPENFLANKITFHQSDTSGSNAGTGVTGVIAMKSKKALNNTIHYGLASDMSFYVSGDTTAGAASDNASKEAMTIQRGTGNVGIGAVDPVSELDVVGVIRAGNNNSTGGGTALRLRYHVAGNHSANFGAAQSSGAPMIGFAVESSQSAADTFVSTANNIHWPRGALVVSEDLEFWNGGAQNVAVGSNTSMTRRFIVKESGHVGIGTASPDVNLHISQSGGNPAILRLENTDTTVDANQVIGSIEFESRDSNAGSTGVVGKIDVMSQDVSPDAAMRFFTSQNDVGTQEFSERMRISNIGNVGIGTPSPQARLSVTRGNDSIEFDHITSPDTNRILSYDRSSGGGELPLKIRGSILTFDTGATERFRVHSNGNVGINVTNPTEKIHSSGAIILGAAASTALGTIQWTGSEFQGRTSNGWESLITSTSSFATSSALGTTNTNLSNHTSSTTNPHSTTFTSLGQTPANFTGAAGKLVKVNSSGNALEFGDLSFADGSIQKTAASATSLMAYFPDPDDVFEATNCTLSTGSSNAGSFVKLFNIEFHRQITPLFHLALTIRFKNLTEVVIRRVFTFRYTEWSSSIGTAASMHGWSVSSEVPYPTSTGLDWEVLNAIGASAQYCSLFYGSLYHTVPTGYSTFGDGHYYQGLVLSTPKLIGCHLGSSDWGTGDMRLSNTSTGYPASHYLTYGTNSSNWPSGRGVQPNGKLYLTFNHGNDHVRNDVGFTGALGGSYSNYNWTAATSIKVDIRAELVYTPGTHSSSGSMSSANKLSWQVSNYQTI